MDCSLSLYVWVQVRSVVLINCGGGARLVELLQPEEHIRIFVVDRFVSLSPLPLPSLSLPLPLQCEATGAG